VYRRPRFAFPQVSAGDLDIAVIGQLPAAQLAFGDQFESGPLKMVAFEAPLWRRGPREQTLEDPPTDAYDSLIFANFNGEFDRHPV
jgi:hypothetical protein